MSNKPTIPEWQRASTDSPAASPERDEVEAQQSVETPTSTEGDIEGEDSEEEPSDSVNLLEQASRFLEDVTIRDAPREKKVAFLESKGVKHGEIESLLSAKTQEDSHTELDEVGERAWSTVRATTMDRKPMST
jgi:hypothetical protein